jgi:hypothetical protein
LLGRLAMGLVEVADADPAAPGELVVSATGFVSGGGQPSAPGPPDCRRRGGITAIQPGITVIRSGITAIRSGNTVIRG